MSIESKLWTAVQNLAGGQIYPGRLPESITENLTTPAIDYGISGGATDRTQTTTLRNPRVRFTIWGKNLDEVVVVEEELIKALDHRPGIGISAVFDGDIDMDDPETGLFRRIVDFLIWDQT